MKNAIASFKIGLPQLLTDPIILAMLVSGAVLLSLAVLLLHSRRSRKSLPMVLLIFGGLMLTSCIAMLMYILTPLGYIGYVYNGTHLHLHIYPRPITIDLRKADVVYTCSPDWRPSIGVNRFGIYTLSMGVYKLNNGVEATVFRYRASQCFLVIRYNNKYYVLITPNIDELAKYLSSHKKD